MGGSVGWLAWVGWLVFAWFHCVALVDYWLVWLVGCFGGWAVGLSVRWLDACGGPPGAEDRFLFFKEMYASVGPSAKSLQAGAAN